MRRAAREPIRSDLLIPAIVIAGMNKGSRWTAGQGNFAGFVPAGCTGRHMSSRGGKRDGRKMV